jgi:hypothetical protein
MRFQTIPLLIVLLSDVSSAVPISQDEVKLAKRQPFLRMAMVANALDEVSDALKAVKAAAKVSAKEAASRAAKESSSKAAKLKAANASKEAASNVTKPRFKPASTEKFRIDASDSTDKATLEGLTAKKEKPSADTVCVMKRGGRGLYRRVNTCPDFASVQKEQVKAAEQAKQADDALRAQSDVAERSPINDILSPEALIADQ